MSFESYLDYLSDYCSNFQLWQYIRLNRKVTRISRCTIGSRHVVSYLDKSKNESFSTEVDALAICTGLHAIPWIPNIEGLEHLKANGTRFFHSSQYWHRNQLQGKRVLVVGSGETAMDLVYEAIQSDCPEVVLSHRSGWLSIPKVLSDFKILGFDFRGALPIDGNFPNLL
jgi:dimethylaniline monooxygenase (N-oxide forming)